MLISMLELFIVYTASWMMIFGTGAILKIVDKIKGLK